MSKADLDQAQLELGYTTVTSRLPDISVNVLSMLELWLVPELIQNWPLL